MRMTTTRFATYNVHNGRPRKGFADMGLYGDCVQQLRADVVGLQEVDKGMLRTKRADMTSIAAETMNGDGFFACARKRWDRGEYGIAMVAKGELQQTQVVRYERAKPVYERRIGQLATVVVNGTTWNVANTHLSLHRDEHVQQLESIARALADRPGPRVLMGDFNLTPEVATSTLEPLGWTVLESTFTYPSWKPDHTVDFICLQGARAVHVEVMSLPVSDHAALLADLEPI
jgi:endonuclease/exonuclease/phosphatase family metal-dependent hydrolase